MDWTVCGGAGGTNWCVGAVSVVTSLFLTKHCWSVARISRAAQTSRSRSVLTVCRCRAAQGREQEVATGEWVVVGEAVSQTVRLGEDERAACTDLGPEDVAHLAQPR